MNEIWKDVDGFNGFYQVSNLGRVKSVNKIRKLHKTQDGYYKVRLQHGDVDKTCRVHRLVAEAFIPNLHNKETVNHIDGNKENNHVTNLEWNDRHEQLQHAYDLNLKKADKGSSNCNAALTDEQVREIRKVYVRQSKEFGTVALGRKYGVSDRVIGLVVRGLSYTNVK